MVAALWAGTPVPASVPGRRIQDRQT